MKPPMRDRFERRDGPARWLVSASLCLLAACGNRAGTSSRATASQRVVATASASASAAENATAPPAAPDVTGTPIATFTPADKAGCALQTADIATYLQRGEVAMAAQKAEVAVSYLIQLHGNEAQIGFAGYDALAKRIARDRGIGTATDHAPSIFTNNGGWIVAWLDEDGLAYARPAWEAEPHIPIDHLTQAKEVPPDDLSLVSTADGSLVAISPYGTGGNQVTLFRFGVPGKAPEAIGLTKRATQPHHPVVAPSGDGFGAVWIEGDGHLQSVFFDASGKPTSGSMLLAPPAKRADLSLLPTSKGFVLTWSEGDEVRTLALKGDATPDGAIHVVGKGHSPRMTINGDDIYLAFVGDAGGKPEQLLLTKLPGTTALVVSDGQTPVKDPPSIASLGARVAVLYTEAMSTSVSTRRAILRTLDAACLK